MFGIPGSDDNSWGLTILSNCCEINPKKPKIDDKNMLCSFVGMNSLDETCHIKTDIIKPYHEVSKGYTYFAENDVIFAKITPCMENGKGGIATGLKNKIGFGSTEFYILRPIINKSNPYWLYVLTTLPIFRESAKNIMTGTCGQLRVPLSFIEDYKISLPPLSLQEKFADFVEHADKLKFDILCLSNNQTNIINRIINVS